MHLQGLLPGGSQVLQSHNRRMRSRAKSKRTNPFGLFHVPWRTWTWLVGICFGTWVVWGVWRSWRHPREAAFVNGRSRQWLGGCTISNPSSVTSFDELVREVKIHGTVQNAFENRYQEMLWDTLIGGSLFPAWSDMEWNIVQYGRGLASDLAHLQDVAGRLVAELEERKRKNSGETDVSLLYTPSVSLLPYRSREAAVVFRYVHSRIDRFRGLQFAASFQSTQPGRALYTVIATKALDAPCRISISPAVPKELVYILLPYRDRRERLKLFMQNFHELRSVHNENIILIISVLRGAAKDREVAEELKKEMFGDCASVDGNSVWIHENDGDINRKFSRGVALREASKLTPNGNSVLFHCDVDMIVTKSFFDRCRHNSIPGSQVYYPVFYSLYPYANTRPMVAERNGFWRRTSFGMTCMRRSDFDAIGAYVDAETRFQGWGSEDVYQFEKAKNMTNLVALRAVDPSLMHRWHAKACDQKSAAYRDCMKTNFVTMGHPLRLGPALLESISDLDQFFERLQRA